MSALVDQHLREEEERAFKTLSLPDTALCLTNSLGFEADRRNNICFIDTDVLVFIVGNVLHIHDVNSGTMRYFRGPRSGVLGAFAVHDDHKTIAVAERNIDRPNIYIISYPELELVQTLADGAARGYTCLTFANTKSGRQLASVSAEPDYVLALWDLTAGSMVLRAKSFTQDTFQVAVHPTLRGILATAGVGHIMFWKMADTFTGLKLQGETGKFGLSELSDITTFAFLSDGRVVSGSDYGTLLLWEGGAIKCEIAKLGGTWCHAGAINAVLVINDVIYTAGDDGYLRGWDLSTVMSADLPAGNTDSRIFEMECVVEILVKSSVNLKAMAPNLKNDRLEMVVQDSHGVLYLVAINSPDQTHQIIRRFHSSGSITVSMCPGRANRYVSGGHDGVFRVHSLSGEVLAERLFTGCITAIVYLPTERDDSLLVSCLVGFTDGIVRLVRHSVSPQTGGHVQLLSAQKAHSSAIRSLVVSSDGLSLVSCADDGFILFCRIENMTGKSPHLVPTGFFAPPQPAQKLTLVPGTTFILSILSDGTIATFNYPAVQAQEAVTLTNSDVCYSSVNLQHSLISNTPPSPGQDITVWPVTQLLAMDSSLYILAVRLPDGGSEVHLCDPTNAVRSKLLWTTRASDITSMVVSESKKALVMGDSSGGIIVLQFQSNFSFNLDGGDAHDSSKVPFVSVDDKGITYAYDLIRYWATNQHDHGNVQVLVTADDGFIISAGVEGGQFIWKNTAVESPALAQVVADGAVLDSSQDHADISNHATLYSFIEAKERTRKDFQHQLNEQEKQKVKDTLYTLQQTYLNIGEKSAGQKMPFNRMASNNYEKLQEADRATIDQESRVARQAVQAEIEKIKSRFTAGIKSHRDTVSSFTDDLLLTSYRTKVSPDVKVESKTRLTDNLNSNRAGGGESNSSVRSIGQNGQSQQFSFSVNGHAKKLDRAQRLAILRAAKQSRPSDSYEDARDLEAIRHSASTVGTYKLKRDSDFTVAANEAVDPPAKLHQIRLVCARMVDVQEMFNVDFVDLRELKQKTVTVGLALCSNMLELTEGLRLLGDDVSAAKQAIVKLQRKLSGKEIDAKLDYIKEGYSLQLMQTWYHRAVRKLGDDSNPMFFGQLNRIFRSLPKDTTLFQQRCRTLLTAERDRVQSRLEHMMREFDDELVRLLVEKMALDCDLKLAEIRLSVLIQEWLVLQSFSAQDRELELKYTSKLHDRDELGTHINAIALKLEGKKNRVDAISEQLTAMEAQARLVWDKNKHADFFKKVYHKKAALRKKEAEESGDVEESDTWSFHSDDESEDDLADAPTDFDQALFAKIIDMRQDRIEQEKNMSDQRKSLEFLRKEFETLIKKEESHQAALDGIAKDMDQLNLRKFMKLNSMHACIALRASQLHCQVQDEKIVDMDDKIVIDVTHLINLVDRIGTIELEKIAHKEAYAELKKELAGREREKHEKIVRLEALNGKLAEVHQLKFGQTVDLDKLESVTMQKGGDDIKATLLAAERQHALKMNHLKHQLSVVEREHQKVLIHNTETLRRLLRLREQRQLTEQRQRQLEEQDLAYKSPAGKIHEAEKLFGEKERHLNEIKHELHYLTHKGSLKQHVEPTKASSNQTSLPSIHVSEDDEYSRPGAPLSDRMFHMGELRSMAVTPIRKHSQVPANVAEHTDDPEVHSPV